MSVSATTTPTAEFKNVSKLYGAFRANDGVNLRIGAGTIHGLIGENGAGKSTAMKMLYGLLAHDEGQLFVKGVERAAGRWSPRHAFENGVGMVHQHFMLAHTETVHDNLVLGVEERGPLGLRKRAAERAKLEKLMADTGLSVPLDRPAGTLGVGEQSRIEILKVLYRNADFLILDEPTAVLTPKEVREFLETLKRLKGQGKTILLVTHKLHEILAVADDITVFRAGRSVGTMARGDATIDSLTEMMIGRPLTLPRRATNAAPSPEVIVSVPSFGISVHPGEVVGIAGIEGNGQDAIVHELLKDPRALRRQAFAVIPPDRHRDAVVLGMDVNENLKLGREQARHKGWELFTESGDDQALATFLQAHDVRPPNPHATVGSLSGGNQQKLVVARELDFSEPAPKAMLICHPTRGVDLGAIEHIHGKLLAAADTGVGILLISSELEELMNLSDRIGVVYKGKLVGWFKPVFDEHKIGRAMLTGEMS